MFAKAMFGKKENGKIIGRYISGPEKRKVIFPDWRSQNIPLVEPVVVKITYYGERADQGQFICLLDNNEIQKTYLEMAKTMRYIGDSTIADLIWLKKITRQPFIITFEDYVKFAMEYPQWIFNRIIKVIDWFDVRINQVEIQKHLQEEFEFGHEKANNFFANTGVKWPIAGKIFLKFFFKKGKQEWEIFLASTRLSEGINLDKLQKNLTPENFDLEIAERAYSFGLKWPIDEKVYIENLITLSKKEWEVFEMVTDYSQVKMDNVYEKLESKKHNPEVAIRVFRNKGVRVTVDQEQLEKMIRDYIIGFGEKSEVVEIYNIIGKIPIDLLRIWVNRICKNYHCFRRISEIVSLFSNEVKNVVQMINDDMVPNGKKNGIFDEMIKVVSALSVEEIAEIIKESNPPTPWYRKLLIKVIEERKEVLYHLTNQFGKEVDPFVRWQIAQLCFKFEKYWSEVLPAGMKKYKRVKMVKKGSPEELRKIYRDERLTFWLDRKPQETLEVIWDNREYHIFLFPDLVVAESPVFGNAAYVAEKDHWEEVVSRTKTELIKNGHSFLKGRIEHRERWQEHELVGLVK